MGWMALVPHFRINIYDANGFWAWQSWLVAIAGAVIVLLLFGLITRRRTAR
jgi:uncharacterized membrane protein YeaQ/YmgE (transglycosylase-associated protein family)